MKSQTRMIVAVLAVLVAGGAAIGLLAAQSLYLAAAGCLLVAAVGVYAIVRRALGQAEEVRQSEKRYRAIMEQSVAGIWVADADDWTLVDVNPAFCEYLGYERDELLGMQVGEFIDRPPEELQFFYEHIMEQGALPPTEGRWISRDGERVDVRITSYLIRQDDGDLVCTVGQDVSEEKRLHDQLELTDRLASLGTLAAGVAHELNNPLSFIITNLHFLETESERFNREHPEFEFDDWTEALDQSQRGAERMKKIVDDLRSFYRSDSPELSLVDVRKVLDSVVGLATSDLPESAELVERYEEVPPVEVNRSTLGQVFLNILINAVQSLQGGRADQPDRITVETRQTDAGHVEVAISDTGVGIPPENFDRIFDPFFTTKPVGEGTGLGLSLSHNIVESFGGDITVDSEVGAGTTFRIELPAAGKAPAAQRWKAPLDEA